VPNVKTELIEAIHFYIAAHQLKSTSDLTHNKAGSVFHQNNQVGGGAFSLITGESEAIKSAYTAVSMYPKEKVNQLLKYRDDIRNYERDSNQISGDKASLYKRGYNTEEKASRPAQLFGEMINEANDVYNERRRKVMS
jgi:hypothetical protein